MPNYVYYWENGDVSLVAAKTKADAVLLLDEVGDVEDAKLTSLPEFAVHLRITPGDPLKDLQFEQVNGDLALTLQDHGYDAEDAVYVEPVS